MNDSNVHNSSGTMRPGERHWQFQAPDPELVRKLAAEAELSPFLAGLLVNRGIVDPEQAGSFLSPDLNQLHPWQLLPDVQPALARLRQARERGEKVLVHGDYDADGITAAALLVRFFRRWGLAAEYFVPHRIDDGYGLSAAGVDAAVRLGCSVLVTTDCGTSDHQQVELARSKGLDVIITDHHLPKSTLPPALAVVNPRREDSRYPFPHLAGVGLAYKLAMALSPGNIEADCVQLAAVGTVADIVPLVGENRVLVAKGLESINLSPLPGLAALVQAAGCRRGEVDAGNIAFHLAPRLNAAGRIDSPREAVELLLARDLETAAGLADALQQKNSRRQGVEEDIMVQALPQAAGQIRQGRRVLVLHHPQWHQGVLGIVASRIVQRYWRPVLMISGSGELTGSARSVEGFDIHAALGAVSRWLDRFGGHRAAAGLTLQQHNLEPFARDLDNKARTMGVDKLLTPVLHLDGVLDARHVTLETAKEIALLQPFGAGNPEPMFSVEGFSAEKVLLAGNTRRHLRLQLAGGGRKVWAIGFGKAGLVHNIEEGGELALAANLQLNRWNGTVSPQLRIGDIRDTCAYGHGGLVLRDRRQNPGPWLEALATEGKAVWFANSRSISLPGKGQTVQVLPPDNFSPRVYNLVAGEYCLLEAPWSRRVFQGLLAALPAGSTLHLFACQATSPSIAFPGLNLLRQFFSRWLRSGHQSFSQLLELLPPDMADQLLLERMLKLFCQAGLARQKEDGWAVRHPGNKVDVTATPAWAKMRRQEEEYRAWSRQYRELPLKQLTALGVESEEGLA